MKKRYKKYTLTAHNGRGDGDNGESFGSRDKAMEIETSCRCISIKRGGVMVTVKIITSDKKAYTDPQKIHIPENDTYAAFYRIVDNYQPKTEEETA